MGLVGKSLDNLVKEMPGNHFSPGTAIGVGIQMIDALRVLHTIGYLHRDIKPANTTIGRQEDGELRLIYLLDFGMARRYTREDVSKQGKGSRALTNSDPSHVFSPFHNQGTPRRPRNATGFRGSPRYAAISAHLGREYCRKDDIESWFYM